MTDVVMSPNIVFVVTIAALFTVGTYLVLERSLTRILLGIVLLGNGTNLLILVAGGAAGAPPLIGVQSDRPMSDPLPQALILTAIVITLGLTAFLLAMAYRSWQLHRHDEVQDDVEDRRIVRLAAIDERFTETAQKLSIKAQRAEARRKEAEAHEKNVRMGKKKNKKEEKPREETSAVKSDKPAEKRGESRKAREQRRREGAKRAAAKRFEGSRPVKKGKGSAKKEKA